MPEQEGCNCCQKESLPLHFETFQKETVQWNVTQKFRKPLRQVLKCLDTQPKQTLSYFIFSLFFLLPFPFSSVPCRCFLFSGTTHCFFLNVFPLNRSVAFLSFPVKYNNVFGLAFLPHFSSLRSTAIVPHFQAFSCLFFFPLLTSQLLPCNRPFDIIP